MNVFAKLMESIGMSDNSKKIELSARAIKIINHYQDQVDQRRIDTITVIDRVRGDLAGRNYHPKKDQCSDIKL